MVCNSVSNYGETAGYVTHVGMFGHEKTSPDMPEHEHEEHEHEEEHEEEGEPGSEHSHDSDEHITHVAHFSAVQTGSRHGRDSPRRIQRFRVAEVDPVVFREARMHHDTHVTVHGAETARLARRPA